MHTTKIPEDIRSWCIERGFDLSPDTRYELPPPEPVPRGIRLPFQPTPRRKVRAARMKTISRFARGRVDAF